MAPRHEWKLFVVSVFLINNGYSYIAPQPSRLQSPKIAAEFETIIEANDNHTVFCEGSKPLKWTTPTVEGNKWTTFETQPEKPTSPEFQYGSRLYIYNMSYPFVGFYFCHHEDADIHDVTGSTNIYLYVNDDKHLSVEVSEDIQTIIVTQYQEALLPCRPTSPDVKVKLTEISDTEIPIDTLRNLDTMFHYQPTHGIFTNDTKDRDKDIMLKCVFQKNGIKTTLVFTILVEIPVSHLAIPDLVDESNGHTIVGNPLKLSCTIKTPNEVQFTWSTPKGPIDLNDRRENRWSIEAERNAKNLITQVLTVYNTTIEDRGTYFCNITDNQQHSSYATLDVKIFGKDEHFLNISEANNLYSLIASAGDAYIQWSIDVHSHPRPTVTWLNNNNETIPMGNGSKYETYYNDKSHEAFLKIKNIRITDFGYYKLLASNGKDEQLLSLFLNVTDHPTVHIVTDPYHPINTPSTVKCSAYANPEPEFKWEYTPCDKCPYSTINSTVTKSEGFEFISEVNITASTTGKVKCSATNYKGDDEAIAGFYVSDVKNGFDIFGFDKTVNFNEEAMNATVAINDPIEVTCGASVYNYSNIEWLFNNQVLQDGDRYQISKSHTAYSNRIQLGINVATSSYTGLYSCRVVGQNGESIFKNISIDVAPPKPPVIHNTNMKNEKEMNIPDKLEMYCEVNGIPKPTITWFKNGAIFSPSEPKRIKVQEDNQKISFKYTDAKDEGTYKCEARNKMGSTSKQQVVKFKNVLRNQTWLIYVIIFLSLLFLGAIIFIVIKIRKEKQLQRELKKLGLANFEKGAVENINPELGIDDQAELLPYYQKWEFPIENLKLGKQLGSGAFGVVMKGEAKNIIEGEPVTTVAVKMVKKNADNSYIRTLASELKIMVHLGKHLNVVNLLGACTKNVAKRELLVIVEFCRFGNLQNYLLRHRDNYINQIDPKTGKLDFTIGTEYFDRSYSVSSDRSNHPILPPSNSMGDYRENARAEDSGATEMTTIQEEGVVLSNNSVQPAWRSNYKGDYKGNVKPICTKDLLAYAFQVARGMEYLASRKVLHGDLAARNILLADNNIVKICDFGLPKSMYKNDNYKKKGNGLLPVKWLAVESIRDRIFSTQSDVWSFGIVLWEFFSLGRSPYPGMEADERLYQKLIDGYRMESPEYAPKEMYNMMTSCWNAKPLQRPSFTRLAERIGDLLEDSLRKYYIDLNDPYLVMNTQRLELGESDYLAMLSPPTFEALSSPHYVNEHIGQESLEDSGYLSMKPNTVLFSPRPEEGQIFDFNIANRKHLLSEEGNGQELLPMLQRRSESECETPTPATPNSFSNPSYHMPPKISEETKEGDNNNADILKTSDNYVNMPQNKNLMKEKDLIQESPSSNPFIQNGKGEVHYVNSNSRDWESVKA